MLLLWPNAQPFAAYWHDPLVRQEAPTVAILVLGSGIAGERLPPLVADFDRSNQVWASALVCISGALDLQVIRRADRLPANSMASAPAAARHR